uniref:Putative lysine-specific demethylase JMJ16 n=1 Tax=Rhizophora mucronata TaxID=61149 RepID=A0A2P2KGT8_RHIMU
MTTLSLQEKGNEGISLVPCSTYQSTKVWSN